MTGGQQGTYQQTLAFDNTRTGFAHGCKVLRKLLLGWIISLASATGSVQEELTQPVQHGKRGVPVVHVLM